MTNRNKGQLRIGKSGPIIIESTIQESPAKIKVGQSGPIVVGQQNIKDLSKEGERSDQDKERIEKDKELIKKNKERIKKDKDRVEKEKERIGKNKGRIEKDKERIERDKERVRKKWIEHINKGKHFDKNSGSDIEDKTIIKLSSRIDRFNVLVQDNKISGNPWYYRLKGDWWQGMSEEEARVMIESGQSLDTQAIKDSQKSENIPLPDYRIITVSDMIDDMRKKCDKDLPKDQKRRISYIYPLDTTNSFHIVANNHIKYLKNEHISNDRHIKIEEIDWSQLSNIEWNEKRSVLLHPFLYPFASVDSFIQNSKNFARLLAMKNKIGGFDVADSDRISQPSVDLINKIDLIMVPSNFAKDVYIKSGVTIPVEVLPHGISDKFSSNNIVNTDNDKIKRLRKMRRDGNILILYFLLHSPHRKGADLVKRVMKRVQKKYPNVCLIVRSKRCDYFSDIRSVCIDSWLSDNDLIALYDSCDICLSPSRGGGFELNALEAASRGLPTLVPNGGCFIDLINYFIPVDLIDKASQPLPGNTVHTGIGCEVDMDNFENKLSDTISRLDYWKECFNTNSKEIREKYSWENTAKMLDKYLMDYRFIE